MKWPSYLAPILLAACASTSEPTLEEKFSAADVNEDGMVSRSEATDLMIADAFQRFDRNGDGFVDEAEFLAAGGTRARFRAVSSSHPGKVTLAEAQAHPQVIETMAIPFDEADVDGNGAITLEEFRAYQARLDAVVR